LNTGEVNLTKLDEALSVLVSPERAKILVRI
jgi:hypothetical protein